MDLIRVAIDVLLALGVGLAVLGALGLWLMRDAFQRIHYVTLPSCWSPLLVTAAVFLYEPQKQAGAKVALIAVVLFAMNAVLSHATARAAWVRLHGSWPPEAPPPEPPR